MSRDEVKAVLGVTLAVMSQLAARTRTPADDLMVTILKANQERLAEAVQTLLAEPVQPPPRERVSAVLEAVGIHA